MRKLLSLVLINRELIYYGAIRGLSLLFSILISVLISRFTSPELFNSFSFIEKLIGVGVVIFVFGSRQTLLVSKNTLENNGFIVLILNRIFILTTIISPLLFLVLYHNELINLNLFLIIIFSIFFTGFSKILNTKTLKKSKLYIFSLFENNIISNIIFLLFFFFLPKELSYLLIYFLFGKTLVMFFLLKGYKNLNLKTLKLTKVSFLNQFKELIESSFFFYNSVFSVFYKSLPLLLLYGILKTDSYSAFVIILKISLITTVFLEILNNDVSKKISNILKKKQLYKIKSIYINSSWIGFMLGFISLMIVVFFGNNLIGLWGSTYEGAYYLLLILFLGDVVDLIFASTGVVLNLCGKKKLLNVLYLCFIPIAAILLVFSAYSFGIFGVVISMSFLKISFNVVKYLLMRNYILQ